METIDGGNRVSKRLTTIDDGNNRSSVPQSSVDQVVSNDDLLTEILLRLPVISLFLFKSVTKRWLSLITRFPNFHPPSGLSIQKPDNMFKILPQFEHDFVWLDTGMKKKSSAFTFGCFGTDASNVEVLQSCNGLVLCVIRTNPADKIYIYNPSLNISKLLPLVDGLKHKIILDQMRMAFDPAKSPRYKVLHVRVINPSVIQTRIYSSETRCWIIGDTFNVRWICGDFDRGVYWNDAIHWLDETNHVLHYNLDTERPYITAELPKTLDWDSYKELFESRGSLLLACAADPHPKHMEIYKDSIIEAFLQTLKMSTMGFRFNVLFIVVGEKEEESFVVTEVCGNIVKYNLLLKTFHVLCHIDTHYLTEFRTIPFIASFASV